MNPLLAPQYSPPSESGMQFRGGVPPPTLPLEPVPPSNVGSLPPQMHSLPSHLHHWFYKTDSLLEGNTPYWKPLSQRDSLTLETALSDNTNNAVVPVMGGRFDAHILQRTLLPVYWDNVASKTDIMRASWFYQGPSSHWIPFPESLIPLLETHYAEGPWGAQKRISLGQDLGHIVFHSREIMLFTPATQAITTETNDQRMVHRGMEGLPPVPQGEAQEMDHLIFVVHGVGKYCDMKLRDLVEVVSSMREKMDTLSAKHFQSAHLSGSLGRVELLPISWHQTLHGEDTGTDSRLKPLTLKSIPKLRTFMNDTLMDILFYTSPVFGQTIVDTVVNEINRVYQLFLSRNPSFKGKVSVMGHSLGSVILFDILSHQRKEEEEKSQEVEKKIKDKVVEGTSKEPQKEVENLEELFKKLKIGSEYSDLFLTEGIDLTSLRTFSADDLKEVSLPDEAVQKIMDYFKDPAKKEEENISTIEDYNKRAVTSDVQYVVGPAGTGQLSVKYPQLDFKPCAFYALGSPIALFVAIRGISSLGENFSFPTCPEFFNIFHPYDPVAYRMEAMVDPQYSELRPITIPHHMGRKRMHLELKDTVTKLMTSDIRKKILEGVSYTLSSVYNMATGQSGGPDELERTMEDEVIRKEELRRLEDESNPKTMRSGLNGGNRVDFVLQEAPLESFNEYLFAIASHISYWDSEDVSLMIIKNINSKMNIRCDEELNFRTQGEVGNFVDANIPAPNRIYGQPPLATPLGASYTNVVPMMNPPPTQVHSNTPLLFTPIMPPSVLSSSSDLSPYPGMAPSPSPVAPPKLYDPSALPVPTPSLPPKIFHPTSAPSVFQSPTPPPPIPSLPPNTTQAFQSPTPPMPASLGPPTTLIPTIPVTSPSQSMPPGASSPLVRPGGYPKVYPGGIPPPSSSGHGHQMGMDPTAPLNFNSGAIGPPPMGGFLPKKY